MIRFVIVSLILGSTAFGQATEIEWLSLEEAEKLHKENPKKFYISVYTDWCGWCKKMDATTHQDPDVIQAISDNYYPVKLDGEEKDSIVFRGKTYKFVPNGRRGYHELPAEMMNSRMSYPTTVFLDEQLNVIQPLPGYQESKTIKPILKYFGEDHFKTTKWEDFKQSEGVTD